LLIVALLVVSAVFFALQYFLFHDTEEAFFLLLQDFTFLPVSVILVSLFLDKIISMREKRDKLERLNMLINDFFNEAGGDIIREVNKFILNTEDFKQKLHITMQWTEADFNKAVKLVDKAEIQADIGGADLNTLRSVLTDKKRNILSMVENPSMLEHDRFSDMLWAVYHLEEELKEREVFEDLPRADKEHLTIDLKRAYRYLLIEWLYFNRYIKQKYPYLFSLALRKSPFHVKDVIIKE